jgi:hypothetical protein
MKFDWNVFVIKLTSRKLWLAVVSFVTLMMTAAGLPDNEIAQAGAVIMAGASVIAYIVAEGLVDANK